MKMGRLKSLKERATYGTATCPVLVDAGVSDSAVNGGIDICTHCSQGEECRLTGHRQLRLLNCPKGEVVKEYEVVCPVCKSIESLDFRKGRLDGHTKKGVTILGRWVQFPDGRIYHCNPFKNGEPCSLFVTPFMR